MSDLRLIRLKQLVKVLDDRDVPETRRGAYLAEKLGGSSGYWSQLLGNKKSFGEKAARDYEAGLGLPYGYLDDVGLAPDAAAIAEAFNRLPHATPEQLAVRKRLYMAIMAMVGTAAPADPTTSAPAPAARPRKEPPQSE